MTSIAVVGGGVAGLATATLLARRGADVHLLEADATLGGRASSADGWEHCSRMMLSNYDEMLALLATIPTAGGRHVRDDLVPVRRAVQLANGDWIRTDYMSSRRVRELGPAGRRTLRHVKRQSVLLATTRKPSVGEYLRMAAQLSLPQWVRLARSAKAAGKAYAFPGETHRYLIEPWVTHLDDLGVRVSTATPVERLRLEKDMIGIDTTAGAELRVDRVVVAASLPAAADLLERSRIAHHCTYKPIQFHPSATATLALHDDEEVVRRHTDETDKVLLYVGGGFYAVYQPDLQRVVSVATLPGGVNAASLPEATAQLLRLRHEPQSIVVRPNNEPGERIFGASPLRADRITSDPRIVFAGSHLSRSYPLDSGEAAVRSAVDAVAVLLGPDPHSGLRAEPRAGHLTGTSRAIARWSSLSRNRRRIR